MLRHTHRDGLTVWIFMKELPYFRITVQEWQNGDIIDESLANQGFFMQVCCYYWAHNCDVTKSQLEKRFRFNKKNIKKLIDSGIIKEVLTKDDRNFDEVLVKLHINFLDFQLKEIEKEKSFYSKMGKLGQKAKKEKAPLKTPGKPPLSNKDKEKDKDKDNILLQPKKKAARKPNVIWDCICELWGWKPRTKTELSRIGKLARDLKLKEASPELIKQHTEYYRKKWPKIDCTPEAIIKHWDSHKSEMENTMHSKTEEDKKYEERKRILAAAARTPADYSS